MYNETIRTILKAITYLFNGFFVGAGFLGIYTLKDDFDMFTLVLSEFFIIGGLISIGFIYMLGTELKNKGKKQRGKNAK